MIDWFFSFLVTGLNCSDSIFPNQQDRMPTADFRVERYFGNLMSSDVNLCNVLATRPTACAVDRNFVFLTPICTELSFQILYNEFQSDLPPVLF